MGPKKKGKGSKLARMSEEERARYLQHRAAIEEEARRRKQQLIATFMKNKLKREEAFTRLNQAKINQQWRQILRKIKITQLKHDLETLWHSFDHVTEQKNKHIQGLLKELDESEDQYARVLELHIETIDKLIVIHEERLSNIHNCYEGERHKLVERAVFETNQMKETSIRDEEYIRVLLFGLEERMTEFRREKEAQNTAVMDELTNTMLSECEQLQLEKENTMEQIWKKFISVLTDYKDGIEPRRSQYSRLKLRDAESSSVIMEHLERIDQLNEKISSLKQQLTSLKTEQESKIDDLKAERQNLTEYFEIMRKRLDNGRNLDRSQLMLLTAQSNDAIKHLQSLVNKGERILKLFEMCHIMETEEDKLIPFAQEILTPEEILHIQFEQKQQTLEPLAQEIFDYSKLENFWKRYSHVYLESLALRLHQDALKHENKQLQGAVRQYLATISQASGLKATDTALIGARPNTTRPIRKHITLITGEEEKVKKVRPITCIEASTSIAVRHMLQCKARM